MSSRIPRRVHLRLDSGNKFDVFATDLLLSAAAPSKNAGEKSCARYERIGGAGQTRDCLATRTIPARPTRWRYRSGSSAARRRPEVESEPPSEFSEYSAEAAGRGPFPAGCITCPAPHQYLRGTYPQRSLFPPLAPAAGSWVRAAADDGGCRASAARKSRRREQQPPRGDEQQPELHGAAHLAGGGGFLFRFAGPSPSSRVWGERCLEGRSQSLERRVRRVPNAPVRDSRHRCCPFCLGTSKQGCIVY